MARYYIIRDGERLFRDTVKAIASLAQKFADEIGAPVTVFEDHTGQGFGGRRKGRVKPHGKKNPAKSIAQAHDKREVHHGYRFLTKRAALDYRNSMGKTTRQKIVILQEYYNNDQPANGRFGLFYKVSK